LREALFIYLSRRELANVDIAGACRDVRPRKNFRAVLEHARYIGSSPGLNLRILSA